MKKSVLVAFFSAVLLTACASTPHQESTGEYIDNTAITTQVKANLMANEHVKSLPITVTSYKGVVQLSGFVDSLDQARRAAEIARKVKGVKAVENNLIIR